MKRLRPPQAIFVLTVTLLFALILAGCAAPVAAPGAPAAEPGAAAPTGDRASTLIIAISEDTASLDPARAFETWPTTIHKATYQTLVTFPPDSVETVIPSLAKSWDISEDGLTYRFTLDERAVFSNGDPVTAADVVFSFNRMRNITGNPSFLAETIDVVEAVDDSTVVLTLTQPDPAILAKLVFGAFSVVNKNEVTANGGTDAADAAETDAAEQWLNGHSAGSGPYVLEKWEPSVETVLVRNPNYWGEPANFERVVLRNIPEAATQKIQLEAGDIDIAMDLSADQVVTLETNPNIAIFQGLSDTLVFVKGNLDPAIGGPASDPKVMEAVRYALDYEGLRALGGGESVTPASMLPVGFLGALPANSGVTRDVEKAKALLDEAGFGEGLELQFAYPDFTFAGVNFGTFAQKIQADLNEAGFNVTLAPAEVQVALENYRQGQEPFGLWLWLPDYRDSLDYVEFLPDGVVGNRLNWTSDNAAADILALRDALKVETDDPTRAAMFEEMQEYLLAQGPYAAVIQPGIQIGLRADIEGFAYNPQWRTDVALIGRK